MYYSMNENIYVALPVFMVKIKNCSHKLMSFFMLKQMYTAPFPFPFRDKNLDTRILLSLTKLNEEYLELLYMGLMSMCASKL